MFPVVHNSGKLFFLLAQATPTEGTGPRKKVMASEDDKTVHPPPEKGILGRFAHLLSAQTVEGVASTLFFLYLAWLDATLYGEVMYALAAGAVVMRVVLFGLYYPLVADLGAAEKDETPAIISRVNVIKFGLLIPAMVAIVGTAYFKGFSFRMAWVLFFICLGFGLESVAETFFADFRVRGRQDREARIKIAGTVLAYGYGFLSAFLGLSPLLVSLFKLVSALVRLGFGVQAYLRTYSTRLSGSPAWQGVWYVFRAATVFALIDILGIVYNKTNIFFLESAVGVKGVAFYSATYNLVDSVSILASEQLLGWVIFPLLATLWWSNRERLGPLVQRTSQWLLALSLPIMFVLYTESDTIIRIVYPAEFKDAAWMQRYLVWTILLSFQSNLFCYVMMVAGAAKLLLVFAAAATALNFLLNVILVYPFGLAGGCMVIILTKLVMTVLTFLYCQLRFRLFRPWDFAFPAVLAGASLLLFWPASLLMPIHRATLLTWLFYCLILWKTGSAFMGGMPGTRASPDGE